ncbi:glycosyltransferase family 39 protein [Candidatus Pacearchaeota archaeon]|nr:glycosyltransferase family 39 protein [Candidatus Pacearchaeota archaeon]
MAKGVLDRTLDGILDVIYSKEKKSVRLLIALTFIGFILRLIAALHLDTLADDTLYSSQSAGILQAHILSTHSNPPLFFYVTDFIYKVLGYTTLASRFFPLIAGTLLIPIIFLITRKFFNDRVALCAAFFATFSNFLVRMTFSEHSLVLFFFSFFAVYLGMLHLDTGKKSYMVYSGVLFGLALLTKYNAPFMILSFFVFSLYYMKVKGMPVKKHMKHILVFIAILIVCALPFLAFNYFIYQEKGIVDVYFSRVIHVDKAQQLYGGLAGQDSSLFTNLVKPAVYNNYNLVFKTDLFLFLFGIAGILLLILHRQKVSLAFLFIFFIIPFVLQSAGSNLQKHFVFMHVLFCIPAGYALYEGMGRLGKKWMRWGIVVILMAFFIINLGTAYGTPQSYFEKSPTSSLKSFINGNVKSSDLIILDSRIYSGRAFWLATDKHFLTLDEFPYVYSVSQNMTGKVATNVYVVECVIDDCGWGWINTRQDINASAEQLLDQFKAVSQKKASIEGSEFSGNEITAPKRQQEVYRIYQTSLSLNPSLVQQTDMIHSFYFAPYLYKNMEQYTYSYTTHGLGTMVNTVSLWIIYLAMILSLIAFLSVFYFLTKSFK